MAEVNLIAVVGVTVASFVIGLLWYGSLFGKVWLKLTGLKQQASSA